MQGKTASGIGKGRQPTVVSGNSDMQKQPSHLHSLKQLLNKVSTTSTTTTGRNLPVAPIHGVSVERNAPISIHYKGIRLNFE